MPVSPVSMMIGGDVAAVPVTPAEFDGILAAIGGFEARPVLAVAVSGGPDSMTLTLLADRWARGRGGRIVGLTVDHGLRPESGEEARLVAGWLAARDIPHAILRWLGDKPASGIQAAAREARYRLLAGWCRANGVLHLLSAHQREDQAETHLIRRRAKSGSDGLAGMSAIRELPGGRLLRPLLAVPKARLAALLAAEHQPFLSDPSNLNPAFERVRLRLRQADLQQADTTEALARTRACAHRRIDRERALDELIGRAVSLHPAGFAAVDPAAIAAAEPDLAERVLGRVAATIGGGQFPARRDRIARLRAGLAAQPKRARTLGGCRFVPWRHRILVLRELAAASPPVRLEPGATLRWDRRFAVVSTAAADRVVVLGYLGRDAASAGRHGALALAGLPRLLYPALPALRDAEGRLAALPHIGWQRDDMTDLPSLLFCPAAPLTRASFTVV